MPSRLSRIPFDHGTRRRTNSAAFCFSPTSRQVQERRRRRIDQQNTEAELAFSGEKRFQVQPEADATHRTGVTGEL